MTLKPLFVITHSFVRLKTHARSIGLRNTSSRSSVHLNCAAPRGRSRVYIKTNAGEQITMHCNVLSLKCFVNHSPAWMLIHLWVCFWYLYLGARIRGVILYSYCDKQILWMMILKDNTYLADSAQLAHWWMGNHCLWWVSLALFMIKVFQL